ASLIAFPPAMREDYARHLQAIMPRQAKMLLVTLEYLQAEMDGPPFSVTEAEVRRLYERGYRIEKLSSEGVLDEFPRFQEKGLRYLTETAYRLTPLG
ncbi:MAG: thiopurine S-methyltransferase, partial [Gammaproteobacteria bacterium]|nr:thiopurine S-methyltransferase [Gammaproteobacteria bacterium]